MGRTQKLGKKKYLKEFARDGWETGHPMGSDDFREFQKICKDDGYEVTKEDWNYYWECFHNIRSEFYS